MAVLASGSYDRNAVTAATSYAQPITIPSGTNRRLLLSCVGGRFLQDTQSVPTYDGVAMTLVVDSAPGGGATAAAIRTTVYELVNPTVGTANFAVTNPGNTNDGVWRYLVIDESTGSARGAYVEGTPGSPITTATPAPSPATGAGEISFCSGGSAAYSGGGALSGSTAVGTVYYGTCGSYRVGANAGVGTWSSNQAAAATVVVPMGANSTATGNFDLDAFTLSGSFATGALSQLAGGVTMDDFALSGFLGLAPGRIDTQPFKNWAGALLPGVTVPNVVFLKLDRTLPLALVNQVTAGDGVMTITNAALVTGTYYIMVSYDATGANVGAELVLAT